MKTHSMIDGSMLCQGLALSMPVKINRIMYQHRGKYYSDIPFNSAVVKRFISCTLSVMPLNHADTESVMPKSLTCEGHNHEAASTESDGGVTIGTMTINFGSYANTLPVNGNNDLLITFICNDSGKSWLEGGTHRFEQLLDDVTVSATSAAKLLSLASRHRVVELLADDLSQYFTVKSVY